jgi:hypothetical protein
LVGIPEENRPLSRPSSGWVDDNIKMDFRVIEWGCRDGIDLTQDRDQCKALFNMAMNFPVP